MPRTTLIETSTLAEHLTDQKLAMVDCRYDLRDEGWGRRQYAEGHIPGAISFHWARLMEKNNTHKFKPFAEVKV